MNNEIHAKSCTYSLLIEQFFFTSREHQLALVSTQSLKNALEDGLFESAALTWRPWVLKGLQHVNSAFSSLQTNIIKAKIRS